MGLDLSTEKPKILADDIAKVVALLAQAKEKQYAEIELSIQDGKLVSARLIEKIRY